MLPGPGMDVTMAIAKAMAPRPAWERGRGKRGSYTRGNRKSSTQCYPSAFEIDPHKFPTLTIPARLQKHPIPADNKSNIKDIIKVDSSILPEAQALLDTLLTEIALGNPPVNLLTTQVALAREAGSGHDSYIPGTIREQAYIQSKSMIAEKDLGN
jgi:hypothetical protein